VRIRQQLKTENKMEKMMNFKMGDEIGRGFSGVVYSAKLGGEQVSVKELNSQQIFKELQAMATLQTKSHPHVVQLKECWNGEEGTKATDVWSFGITLWEMITLQKPYHGKSIDYLRDILKHQHQVDSFFHFNFPFCDVAKTCLNLDIDKRPTFEELVITLEDKFEGLEEEIKEQEIKCGHEGNWKNTKTRVSGPVVVVGYEKKITEQQTKCGQERNWKKTESKASSPVIFAGYDQFS